MKRSQINQALDQAVAFLKERRFLLPPSALWTPEEWSRKGPEYDEIRDNALGWDVTDFGSGDFERVGLVAYTLRSGSQVSGRYPKPYAEKIMIVREGQRTPMHFHRRKMEDIINRGGGILEIEVYASDAEERLSADDVTLAMDGRRTVVPAGTVLALRPGESVTFLPGQYHSFWGRAGAGLVMVGEVSQANDDVHDNRFLDGNPRFTAIVEDEPARYPLGSELPPAPLPVV